MQTKTFQSIEIRIPNSGRHVHPPEDFRLSIHEIIGTGTLVVQAWETSCDWSEHGTRQSFADGTLMGKRLGKIATRRIDNSDEGFVRRAQADLAEFAFYLILKHGQLVANKVNEQGPTRGRPFGPPRHP